MLILSIEIFLSSNKTVPESADIRPDIILIKVVFPTPLGPRNAKILFSLTVKLIFFKTSIFFKKIY